jgi:putative flavoprotein involved in K+ transport
MEMNKIETIIVGGGQGGLAVSYYLAQAQREHLVLEQAAAPAKAWREERWDSFTLVTPNWSFRLPGAEYQENDPHGYMPRAEIVRRFGQYVERYRLPVRYGVRVLAIEPGEAGYQVRTDEGDWEARNVVVATGLFQKPKIPPSSAGLGAEFLQLPSGSYRNPAALPPGGVLVVGSAQSGCQIAEELYQSGRPVYLCVGSAGRAPRRYRGRDIIEWLHRTGFFDRTVDKLPSPEARFAGNPQASGARGGHTINLHQFYRDGVVLLGRLQGCEDGRVFLAGDLKANLAKVDQLEANLVKMIDVFIQQNGLDAPEERLPALQDGYAAAEVLSLDLRAAGIRTVIWALGYSFDFSLVKLPVFDEYGFPQSQQGATRFEGLYFAGLPWLPGQKSGLLLGVGEQAGAVASQILEADRQT